MIEIEIIELLIQRGARDIMYPDNHGKYSMEKPAIHSAAAAGKLDNVQALLDYDFNPDLYDEKMNKAS